MTTLHILVSPHSPVHIDNRTDPFAIAVIKFIDNMMNLGWKCIHYGIEGSDVNCENVICLNPSVTPTEMRVIEYNKIAGIEIAKRKVPGDLILCYFGIENRGAAEYNNDLKIIEPSIGYTTSAVFAPYRVFTSYAQMHFFYGERGMLMNPSWFDAVIYNAISADEFEFNDCKRKDQSL